MAKVVGVFNTAHSPFCYMDPERWNEVRANRALREDVPLDDLEENKRKGARIKNGFATLRSKLNEVNPDAIVIFGDDQLECFDFNNFPAMAVYVGEEFEGALSSGDRGFGQRAPGGERPQVPKQRVKGHPELAVGLLRGLMQHGFDPAFCMDMPKPERGVGHAILRPAESLTDFNTPIVPVLLNCYYAPQPTAMRCYEMGKAVREVIEQHPSDLRVAVVGSGGLWHTPGAKDAYLDEDFDRTELSFLEAGDIRGMAEFFDTYQIPQGDASQFVGERGRGSTGMPGFGGPQGGTRETCNWIAASGVADGSRSTIVDYVPVYASPVGAGFSYCTDL
jgi:aromatic ring-opening dioxygenase catalytic subunit (LigB family)